MYLFLSIDLCHRIKKILLDVFVLSYINIIIMWRLEKPPDGNMIITKMTMFSTSQINVQKILGLFTISFPVITLFLYKIWRSIYCREIKLTGQSLWRERLLFWQFLKASGTDGTDGRGLSPKVATWRQWIKQVGRSRGVTDLRWSRRGTYKFLLYIHLHNLCC